MQDAKKHQSSSPGNIAVELNGRDALQRYSTLLEKTPIVSQPAQGQSHSELVTSKRKRKETSPFVTFDEILADDIRMDDQKLDQTGRDHDPSDILLGVRNSSP